MSRSHAKLRTTNCRRATRRNKCRIEAQKKSRCSSLTRGEKSQGTHRLGGGKTLSIVSGFEHASIVLICNSRTYSSVKLPSPPCDPEFSSRQPMPLQHLRESWHSEPSFQPFSFRIYKSDSEADCLRSCAYVFYRICVVAFAVFCDIIEINAEFYPCLKKTICSFSSI